MMSNQTSSPTATLGRFVADTARRPLREDIARKAAICLLDALGLALLAHEEPTVAAMRSVATPLSGPGTGARLWGSGCWTVLSEAVATNATAVHALFQDDNDVPSWSHPASLVTPVALCCGDSADAPVTEVLRALAVGYGAIAWLGAGERVARALIQRGIRTSPTLGIIAAAATAAAMSRLDEGRATSAVGIAASLAGGVLEPVGCGSDEWRVQNAHAARGGLLAAQLAARGIQGAVQALEGPKGLMRALAGLESVPEWEHAPTVDTLLEVWAKPWATLGDNVPAVAAAHALRAAGVPMDRVEHIRACIWRPYAEYPGTSYRGPFDTVAQALASTAFGIAAMLRFGQLDYGVSVRYREDPAIVHLVSRIAIEPHDGQWHEASIEAVLVDGTILRRTCADGPRRLMFQDQATAIELFEQRSRSSGRPSGIGTEIAASIFAAVDGGASPKVRALLGRLS
jgi:2-methylcitrate dehydratase PrpD